MPGPKRAMTAAQKHMRSGVVRRALAPAKANMPSREIRNNAKAAGTVNNPTERKEMSIMIRVGERGADPAGEANIDKPMAVAPDRRRMRERIELYFDADCPARNLNNLLLAQVTVAM